MMTEAHNQKLQDAKKRVAEMDKTDGFADRSIGATIAALNCGLKHNDDSPAYDALAMLLDCQSVLRERQDFNTADIKQALVDTK